VRYKVKTLALLGCYAAQISSHLLTFREHGIVPTFRGQPVFLDCLNLEDGTDKLSRNVSNWLPICAL